MDYQFTPENSHKDPLTQMPESVIKILADYVRPADVQDCARELLVELKKLELLHVDEPFNGREYVHSIHSGKGLQTYADRGT